MATRRKKKAAQPAGKWQARPNDAIRLAALRWFALELERMSIQIYASNPELYGDMEGVLRKAVKSMGEVGRDLGLADEDCPEGYFLCRDGICAPMCDPFIAIED